MTCNWREDKQTYKGNTQQADRLQNSPKYANVNISPTFVAKTRRLPFLR